MRRAPYRTTWDPGVKGWAKGTGEGATVAPGGPGARKGQG